MKPALVIGAAECVDSDVLRLWRLVADARPDPDFAMVASTLPGMFTVSAANDGGVLWPGRLDHWATMHPDELPEREARREARGYPDGYEVWTKERVGTDWFLSGGSSGLLAASVAAKLGHRKIILCGVPLSTMAYAVPHVQHGTEEWPHANVYQRMVPSLAKQHSWLKERVRSMSGWTAEFFGKPTLEWIEP